MTVAPTSALYEGRVHHARLVPFEHRFSYRVFYGLFDIDELDSLDSGLRLFSLDRFNVFSLSRADHGPATGGALRPWVETALRHADVHLDGGRILLLTFPRVLGYVFNPISVWYCYRNDGRLAAVLHEVRNTFGHRHTYVAPLDAADMRHGADKALHVSPFNDMDDHYSFTLSEPGRNLTIAIDESGDDGVLFRAGLRLRRVPFTDRNLARLFFTHPLLTIKVIAGIHFEAFKLWRKGARYRPVPPAPVHEFSVITPDTSRSPERCPA